MIVDCHVNVYEDHQILQLQRDVSVNARPGGYTLQANPERVHAGMGAVDKAILFSLRYADSAGIDGDDEVTARAVAKYPGKFVGFATVDPRRADAMELLRHAIEDLHLKGVKSGPIYSGVSLLDPRMEPIYAYCVKHNLPLTLHMGTTYARNAPADLGRPIYVDEVVRHPELKIVMAHMGHPWWGECIIVARKQPNVYCEVSALYYRPWQFWNILITAQEYTIHDRDKIFWGTDFPYTTPEDSLKGLPEINRQVEIVLPRVSQVTIDGIIYSNPFEHWWHGGLQI